jgi:hypothetical protein
VVPQTPPDASGHRQHLPSRVQTARFTSAGMCRGLAEGPRRRGAGLLHEPLLLVVRREEEVEGGLEHGLGIRPGIAVRQRIASCRQLGEEALGDGGVEPAQVAGERFDLVRPGVREGAGGGGRSGLAGTLTA